ncbi:MAG: CDP-alcohol phosphatidyltransferase family protein [Nitriliruptoraceae bacterium]|nr:CDP-alcohol phosphatidyltransferase family protein [Nitriliruptoraceae bacterium]
MPTSKPSIDELRRVTQAGIVERRSAEHWAGRLYMRPLSPYVTRQLIRTKVSPDALTLAMIVVGLISAGLVAVPALWSAVVAALLVQLYLLLDCVDGEVARWTQRTSAAGVYLDRLGHHVVEAAIVVGLGVRAGGGLSSEPSWWYVLGAFAALLVVIGKLESDLVTVARAGAGLPADAQTDPSSRVRGIRSMRQIVAVVPIHRLVGAIEISLAVVIVATIDLVRTDLLATRSLLGAVAVISAVVAVGHPLTILTSGRLR